MWQQSYDFFGVTGLHKIVCLYIGKRASVVSGLPIHKMSVELVQYTWL